MNILITDDHPILRRGLVNLIKEEFPFATVDEAHDAEAMMGKVWRHKYDLLITDITLPGRSGLECIIQVHNEFPRLPILVLSMHPEEQYATRILKAGASGYINKEAVPEELVKAINMILQGRKYITPSIAEKLADDLLMDQSKRPHELLSNREFDVFKLLASGKSNGEIAEALFLSTTTVSTYRSRILTKMNLKKNADLTVYAIENKIL